MHLSVGILLIAALLAPPLYARLGRLGGWLFALVPAAVCAYLATSFPFAGAGTMASIPWVPALDVQLAFRLDGLSATLALLVTGIGALIVLYASGYLAGSPLAGRFLGGILLFMAAMLGLVLSEDVLALFVFWELTSISSFLLIGFKHEDAAARAAALKALLVTGGGGLALLAGLVLLIMAGTDLGLTGRDALSLSRLSQVGIQDHPHYAAILVLVLVGAFTKSAQVPFHFWLPAAMAAPTPASAYLHSATMVKAGVFLLARLHPTLGGTDLWHWLIVPAGAVTMLTGAFMAIAQTDLKRILAYSTLAVLGTLVMLLGAGTDLAIKAAIVFLVAHALYKAALFMVAGNVDYATGTRDVRRLGGLARAMPLTAAGGLLAALSQAGAPPMFGFIGKELLYKAKLDLETIGGVLTLLAIAANVLLVAAAFMVAVWPFLRRRPAAAGDSETRRVPLAMSIGPFALGVLGLFIGLVPGLFDHTFGTPMATAIAGKPLVMKLTLWHGVDPTALTVLALSAATLTLGVIVFRRHHLGLDTAVRVGRRVGRYGPEAAYDRLYEGLLGFAAGVARGLEGGGLRRDLLVVITVAVGVLLFTLGRGPVGIPGAGFGDVRPHELALALITLGAALAAVRSRSRLTAIVSLGATGLGIAVLFALFGAPDLAITQLVVEVLTVIVLVLLFRRLPPLVARTRGGARARDALIAVAGGGVITVAIVLAAAVGLDRDLSAGLAAASVPEAYGRNVVNVILVDFRALDTLGEITVVAAAALGVVALMRRRARTGPEPAAAAGPPMGEERT
jgi:multicomponent Na+:H+ antiporter subunit A